MSERETWMDLVRNEYDQAPSHYKMGDNWDDGAGRIADAILADKMLLLRKIEGLERVLQATQGRIMNARVDIDTGHTKAAVSKTLTGIIEFIDGALALKGDA